MTKLQQEKMRQKTDKLIEMYEFIRRYMTMNNASPTYEEICMGTSIRSKSTAYEYVRILENAGVIETDNHARIILIGYTLVETFDIKPIDRIKKEVALAKA